MPPLTTPRGRQPAILDPTIWWAPLQTKLPARALPFGAPWPAWNLIYDTANGAAFTIRNPQVAISGDKRGRLRSAPGEDFGVALGLDNRTPTEEFMDLVSNLASSVLATQNYVASLRITTGNTAASTVTVNVNLSNALGVLVAFPVVIPANASAIAAADAIRAATFAGYTTGGAPGTDTVTFTSTTTGTRTEATFTTAGSVVGQMGTAQVYSPETTVKTFDRSRLSRFMVGLEGVVEAGTWRDVDTMVRAVVYWAEDTANAEHIWRSAGADSIFHAATTLEALPSTITPAMVQGTGYRVEDLDKDGRFNYLLSAPVAA